MSLTISLHIGNVARGQIVPKLSIDKCGFSRAMMVGRVLCQLSLNFHRNRRIDLNWFAIYPRRMIMRSLHRIDSRLRK